MFACNFLDLVSLIKTILHSEQLNAVGRRYLELRREWTTNVVLEPSRVFQNVCEFTFRGYHGIYDIDVIFPDGQLISSEVKLYPKSKPLLVEINAHGT